MNLTVGKKAKKIRAFIHKFIQINAETVIFHVF